jgi:hypothetical protein
MDRPKELAYALDEWPPWIHLVGLGFQRAAVICPYLVMALRSDQAAKRAHTKTAQRTFSQMT